MNDIIFNIAKGNMILCFFICIIFIVFPIRMKRNKLIFLWYYFMVSLAVFSFFSEPSVSDDLYQHYVRIDLFRLGEDSYSDSPLLMWKLITFLVSRTRNNGWLPFFSVLIFGVLVGSVVNDYLKKEDKYVTRQFIIYYFAVLGGCPVFYIISGVRNALVFAIWVYTYYFYYKKKIVYYAVCIISSLIHPVILLVAFIALVHEKFISKNRNYLLTRVLVPCIVIFVAFRFSFIQNVLQGSSISYLRLIGSKLRSYSEYTASVGNTENTIRWIIMIYCLFMSALVIWKTKRIGFFQFVVIITVSFSSIIILFERLSYLVGLCSVYGITECSKMIRSRYMRTLFYWVSFAVFSFQLLFSFYAMFAHIEFNGHSFHQFWTQFNVFG